MALVYRGGAHSVGLCFCGCCYDMMLDWQWVEAEMILVPDRDKVPEFPFIIAKLADVISGGISSMCRSLLVICTCNDHTSEPQLLG